MFILAYHIQFMLIHSASNQRRLTWKSKYLSSMSSEQTPFQVQEYMTHPHLLSSACPNGQCSMGKAPFTKPALKHIQSLSICIRCKSVSIRLSNQILKDKWKRRTRRILSNLYNFFIPLIAKSIVHCDGICYEHWSNEREKRENTLF